VKRNQAGGVQFSKDPLNLTNLHARKVRPTPSSTHQTRNRKNQKSNLNRATQYSSLANPQAIGIESKGDKIVVSTKIANNSSKPAKSYSTTTFKSTTPSRKLINNAVSGSTKRGYRQDLHMEAIQRASAVKKSTRAVKASNKVTKLRGGKAKKAAAEKQ
jgi:large subunit ribosomal protein L28e